MNGPNHENAVSEAQAQRDATRSTVQHRGPTAERYDSALERYVQAVSADSPHGKAGAGVGFPAQTVGDVMNRSVVSAYTGAAFKEIARALERNRINGVPVIDEQHRVVGVVTASDLLARVAESRPVPRGHRLTARSETHRKRHAATAQELMTSPPIVTTANSTIADAARLAARSRVRSLPVVDAEGVLVGMVTRGDLIKPFLRPDEDIRHDIIRDVLQNPMVHGRGKVIATVDDGVVTLVGEMTNALAARGVVLEVENVPGVIDVRDQLDFEINDLYLPRQH
jgi:CBS domain-containing protein